VIQAEEAITRILSAVRPLAPRTVSLADALGCFAARDCFARVALPPFDNSAMDGYAVVASSCSPGASLRIVGEQPAGLDRQLHVGVGEAVRILTGAPMPRGADAVVMQEETTVTGDHVIVNTSVEPGEFMRRRGGDTAEGQKIVSRGQPVRAATVAVLASQGFASVEVGGAVRASIISTGDELAAPGAELRAGQIYDSNTPLLQALLRKCGAVVESSEHCADDDAATAGAVSRGIQSDVLIITGGVSVGARDFVKSAITAAGGQIDLWHVAVKPGKPFLFGRAGDCAIFGLPGNPVSAFVTFLLFVRPALLKLAGAADEGLSLPSFAVRVESDVANDGPRPHYLRGLVRNGAFEPVGRQESHAVFGLSRANALLLVPSHATIARGEIANVFVFD
jgi:molybdopterin molybdotransferase